ncbi:hypothetical protein EDB89DRAFT_1951427 [Lactarius sanguifluus]|nr:hypothetical protein EDB89DRAFT_1951427 [Lactarius sanguifluus]
MILGVCALFMLSRTTTYSPTPSTSVNCVSKLSSSRQLYGSASDRQRPTTFDRSNRSNRYHVRSTRPKTSLRDCIANPANLFLVMSSWSS